jgi:hypothetical protein
VGGPLAPGPFLATGIAILHGCNRAHVECDNRADEMEPRSDFPDASVDPTEGRCAYSQMRKKTNTRQMCRGLELGYPGSDCPGCNDRQGRLGAEVRRSAFPASNSCQAVYRGKNELTPEVLEGHHLVLETLSSVANRNLLETCAARVMATTKPGTISPRPRLPPLPDRRAPEATRCRGESPRGSCCRSGRRRGRPPG